ncbi:MAG: MetQ/NlpA family ABC transporter substrate-binding protein [Coriobacteriaceae bacterium]|nr:MetQ/NlpA family ABC transporter substrate-binding protein [Coriobacteriaceae bacterium]
MALKNKAVAFAAAAVLAVGCFGLTACGASQEASSGDDKVITVGATPTPHAEVLENAVAPILEEQGYDLQVTVFEDYVQPNTAVESGELDANYFQHINYLDAFNEENGTNLVNAGYVHYEPFGLYAGKSSDLENIADGAKIAVPNDTTNEARALLLLQQEGLITLADGAGVTATTKDIVDNPKNLEIVELEAAQVSHSLQDVDFGIINGNYALEAGLSVADALAVESAEGVAAEQYGNIIAVADGNQDSEKIKALVAACQSDEVAKYIEDTYNGAVVPLTLS